MHQAIIVITLGPRSSIPSITITGSARASTFVIIVIIGVVAAILAKMMTNR